ncbi:hypothetical protein SEA_HOLLOW_73 [Gordonia phage Hollow]|nr:hypothetical protein SEA_HOLLOW_73 [Gordonia phage Hollow]
MSDEPEFEIIEVLPIGTPGGPAHEYELGLTPPLNERDGRGEYRLPMAHCKCGWFTGGHRTTEEAEAAGKWHCDTENTRPPGVF